MLVLRSDKANARRNSMPAASVTDSDQVNRDSARVFNAPESAGTRMINACNGRAHNAPRRIFCHRTYPPTPTAARNDT